MTDETIKTGVFVNSSLVSLVNGFLLGIGLILAALVMRILFHISFC